VTLTSSGPVQVSKRQLGEGYILGISVLLISVLVSLLYAEGPRIGGLAVAGSLPVLALVAVFHWFRQLDVDGDQLWRVAKFAGLGVGLTTLCLFGLQFFLELLTVSAELTVVLVALLGSATVGGALVGIAGELHRSAEHLSVRNAVLHRLLRHNLRNDMNVVLAHIDEVKSEVEEPEREKLEAAERKIHALVGLTDKARQVNATLTNGERPRPLIDLASVIERRIVVLRQSYPAIDIESDLPEAAPVFADEQFGVVLDNVVESAVTYNNTLPELYVDVTVTDSDVVLTIEDGSRTIPRPDLSAIASGTEDELQHGTGMELWLVYWLVEHNRGEVTVRTGTDKDCIEITLPRARVQDRDYRFRGVTEHLH